MKFIKKIVILTFVLLGIYSASLRIQEDLPNQQKHGDIFDLGSVKDLNGSISLNQESHIFSQANLGTSENTRQDKHSENNRDKFDSLDKTPFNENTSQIAELHPIKVVEENLNSNLRENRKLAEPEFLTSKFKSTILDFTSSDCPFDDAILCRQHKYISAMVSDNKKMDIQLSADEKDIFFQWDKDNKELKDRMVNLKFFSLKDENLKKLKYCYEIEILLFDTCQNSLFCHFKSNLSAEEKQSGVVSPQRENEITFRVVFEALFNSLVKLRLESFHIINKKDVLNFLSLFTNYKIYQDISTQKPIDLQTFSQIFENPEFDKSNLQLDLEDYIQLQLPFKNNGCVSIDAKLDLTIPAYFKLSLESGSEIVDFLVSRFIMEENLMPLIRTHLDQFKSEDNPDIGETFNLEENLKLKYFHLYQNLFSSISSFAEEVQKKLKIEDKPPSDESPNLKVECMANDDSLNTYLNTLYSSKSVENDLANFAISVGLFEYVILNKENPNFAKIFKREEDLNIDPYYISVVTYQQSEQAPNGATDASFSVVKNHNLNQANSNSEKPPLEFTPSNDFSRPFLYSFFQSSDMFDYSTSKTGDKDDAAFLNLDFKKNDIILETVKAIMKSKDFEFTEKGDNKFNNFVKLEYGIPDLKKSFNVLLFQQRVGIFKTLHVAFQSSYFSHEFILPISNIKQMTELFNAIIDKAHNHYKSILKATESPGKANYASINDIIKVLTEILQDDNLGSVCHKRSEEVNGHNSVKFKWIIQKRKRELRNLQQFGSQTLVEPFSMFLLEREQSIHDSETSLWSTLNKVNKEDRNLITSNKLTGSEERRLKFLECEEGDDRFSNQKFNLFLHRNQDKSNPWSLSFVDEIHFAVANSAVPVHASIHFAEVYEYDHKQIIENFLKMLRDKMTKNL